jgi:hypothetical protein
MPAFPHGGAGWAINAAAWRVLEPVLGEYDDIVAARGLGDFVTEYVV